MKFQLQGGKSYSDLADIKKLRANFDGVQLHIKAFKFQSVPRLTVVFLPPPCPP